MKTAISIPDAVFDSAEQFARRKKLSRSALFTIAVKDYLSRHRQEGVTEQLDKVYGKQVSAVDAVLSRLQTASLPKEKW